MAKFFNIFRYLKTTWVVLFDKRTPTLAKVATAGAFAYLVSPFDIVGDILPVLGWFDDGLAMWLLPNLAFKLLPPDMYAEVKAKMEGRPIGEGVDAVAPENGEPLPQPVALLEDKALPAYVQEQ